MLNNKFMFYLMTIILIGISLIYPQKISQIKRQNRPANYQKFIQSINQIKSNKVYSHQPLTSTTNKNIFGTDEIVDSVIFTYADDSKLKNSYKYNSDSKIELMLNEKLNGTKWENLYLFGYYYNNSGNHTYEVKENWDGTAWIYNYLITHFYKDDNKLDYNLTQIWDGKVWIDSSRTTYTYDIFGNIYKVLNENWNGTDWEKVSEITAAYNSDGKQTIVVENYGTNAYQTTYSYDSGGNIIHEVSGVYSSGKYENLDSTIYTYDSDGKQITNESFYWDENISNWAKDTYILYTYDSNGNNINILEELWNGTNWVNDNQIKYTYDANGNVTSAIGEFRADPDWVPYDIAYVDFTDSFGNNYDYFSAAKIEIFYKSITGVKPAKVIINKFELSQNYPNPFNPSTKIKYEIPISNYVTLKVYDLLGREVKTLVNKYQSKGVYEVILNGNNLSSGIYIYHLNAGKYSQCRKMILQK
jgi:Secretion system C-terminal sorting domain